MRNSKSKSYKMIKKIIATCLVVLSLPSLAININVQITNQQQAAIKDVVVYLEPLNTELTLPQTNRTVSVKQLDKRFAPYINVMQIGNKVLFDNQDDITHHIYSPIGDNKFELKLRAGNSELKEDFNAAGEIVMGCNIHDWMSGYLLVLDTPYFEKTNHSGVASLKIDTAGEYHLIVWHPQLDKPEHKITQKISINNNTTLNINLGNSLKALPEQSSDDDFDFLSDY